MGISTLSLIALTTPSRISEETTVEPPTIIAEAPAFSPSSARREAELAVTSSGSIKGINIDFFS